MTATSWGFIGLGNMGGPMCGHLCAAGLDVTAYDAAGTTERLPAGAKAAADTAAVAAAADTIFLSLPDGRIVTRVAEAIAAAPGRRTRTVVDLSTTGPDAAAAVGKLLAAAGIVFVDAPVSGGKAGAVKASLAVMCAGPNEVVTALAPTLRLMGRNVFHVGTKPGQGQAMKLANNFLSSVAMVATSEAVLFGMKHGLDMTTMIDVLNVSSGQNTATSDKFPNRIAKGKFDAGFATALMAKDVALYRDHVRRTDTPDAVADLADRIWKSADAAMPGSDFTEIWRHLGGKG